MAYRMRPVQPQDNPALKALVLETLQEFGCVGPGYASSDPEIERMYETYQAPQSAFFVIEDEETDEVLGGGGFSRLKGTTDEEAVCEFQKFYFDPKLRGQGMGRKLITYVMAEAHKVGFRDVYLETVPQMQTAISLYRKMGFEPLSTHRGNTGHHERCPIRMGRTLEPISELISI